MAPVDPREYGRLEEKVEAQRRQIEHISEKLDELLELANRSRGGFWAGMTFVSAISAALSWLAQNLLNR